MKKIYSLFVLEFIFLVQKIYIDIPSTALFNKNYPLLKIKLWIY